MPRLTSKGQVTIPKRIRDYLGLEPGAEVEFVHGPHGEITIRGTTSATAKTRTERERQRMKEALAHLRGSLDLGMTTDEFMRFLRGDPEE